jgi:SNF2 family DNA or RNA helicase
MGKSLRNIIPDFTEAIYETHSGEESLNKYVKPLLLNSISFYRISSFFTPSAIKKIFSELFNCLQNGGDVKFIIGIHDSEKLIPVLNKISERDSKSKFIIAVEEIIYKELTDLIEIIESNDCFIDVLAELIYQKHINIKISAVRKDFEFYKQNNIWPNNQSIFHAKTSILKDENDSVIIGGTINFSNQGYGNNVEDVVILGSWFSPKACKIAEDQFFQIWENNHKDTFTIEFNESLRKVISSIVDKNEIIRKKIDIKMNNTFNINHLSYLIQNSPLFYHYSFRNVRLLPHQNQVYHKILSRWPIFGLIADEVGLGKTIETGASIKYLKNFCNIKRTALLVPSSLRYQWQSEMYNLFGLKFYVYDSNTKSLNFSPNNEKIDIINHVSTGNFFDHGVENIIFSWHYLRLRSANGEYRLSELDKIELAVVDEAHAARMSDSLTLGQNSTQLYQFLSYFFPLVKHKILVTATPFQTNLLDYHSLLELLVDNNDLDNSSFEKIIRINSGVELTANQKISGMFEIFNRKTYFPIGSFDGINKENLPSLLSFYKDELYIQNHPTTIMTIRNTRDELKTIGYQFPKVSISSKPISLNNNQERIFNRINSYIENQLFNFETSVRGSAVSLGFVKTIYQQRIVSSFKACLDTLTVRLNNLEKIIEDGFVEGDLVEVENDEDDTSINISLYERIILNEIQINVANTEIIFIKEILTNIQNVLFSGAHLLDPKIEKAIEIVINHLKNNDTIILFSRFTSTTNFLIDRMKEINQFSFARYQGDSKELIKNKVVEPHDRQILSDMFSRGEFPVIVCSDAASEGLNLQKANVLINVDVPWNPSRLLQRFGRIDRFGQKKDQLFFYNLYYPDTIEDIIYTRLIDRNIEFRQILGSTPEITSREHIIDLRNRELIDNIDIPRYLYKNSLLRVKDESNKRIHSILLKLIQDSTNCIIINTVENNISEIQQGIIKINDVELRFSTSEMDEDYLDLNHPFLYHLPIYTTSEKTSLHGLKNSKNQLLVYCIVIDQNVYPLFSIVEFVKYLIEGKPLLLNEYTYSFSNKDLTNGIINYIKLEENNCIYHNYINFYGSVSDMYDSLFLEETNIKIPFKYDNIYLN